MPRVGFEPTISAGERPKTYALDRAATGTGVLNSCSMKCFFYFTRFYEFVTNVSSSIIQDGTHTEDLTREEINKETNQLTN